MKNRPNQASHDLDEKRLEVDRQRVEVDRIRADTEALKATTDRIDQLMEIVRYLNEQQEGEETVVESTFERTTMVRKRRNLNPHEEDIFNASLIQVKRLIGFQ